MNIPRFVATLALACALACVLAAPATAQDIVPTTPSSFLSIALGAAAMMLTTVILPLAVLWGKQMIAEHALKVAQLQDQLRATIDSGAQKAIGGALGKIDVPEGKLPVALKSRIITDAGAALAKNFGDTLTSLGIDEMNHRSKAMEVVESRLGMMDAQAAGNPVPNPSQPLAAPASQNVTASPNKK